MDLFKPYIPLITARPEELQDEIHLPRSSGFALEVELAHKQNLKKTIPLLINSNYPFLLFINRDNNLIDEEMIDMITLCLFSKNYIQGYGKPVLAFLDYDGVDENEKPSLFTEHLIERLQMQGWPSITQWHFSSSLNVPPIDPGKTKPLYVQQSGIDPEYIVKNVFADFHYIGNYILFRQNTLQDGIQLEQNFFDMYNQVLNHDIELKKGLEEYISVKRSAEELSAKNVLLAERLANAEKTIAVIRNKYKDDYENLFKWYHNEYEILPKWYKRFGHILKVLMGKRSFKSLFYDHVKKYKN